MRRTLKHTGWPQVSGQKGGRGRLIGFLKKERRYLAKGIPLPKQTSGDWEPWSDDVRAEFEAVAPPRAGLIYELRLGTGQRIGDVVTIRWGHI